MTIGVLLFWCFIALLAGIGVGSFIQHRLDKRDRVLPAPIPSENNLAREGDLEILRAWRTRAGKVWLEMDGARLEDKAALQPDQQRRLLTFVVDMRPWLSDAPTPEPKPTPQSVTASTPVPPTPPATPLPEKKTIKPAPAPPPTAPAMKTIIQQIDDVLQAKLSTSVFKERGIQLTEGPGGEVIVQDGLKKYEGIDAVPDPEIKALIRQAITQWEQSTK